MVRRCMVLRGKTPLLLLLPALALMCLLWTSFMWPWPRGHIPDCVPKATMSLNPFSAPSQSTSTEHDRGNKKNAKELLETLLLPHVTRRTTFPDTEKRYRACILTVTRNEYHLTEYLVRNILAGVDHFWLFDDNRASSGIDMDITSLVQPFKDLGYVTVVSTNNTATTIMKEEHKQYYMRTWLEMARPLCKWGSVTDGDEVWYPLDPSMEEELSKLHRDENAKVDMAKLENDKSGVNLLVDLLERMDEKHKIDENVKDKKSGKPQYNVPRYGWGETYEEKRVLKGERSLMLDYPKTCYYNWHRKLWSKLDDMAHVSDHVVTLKPELANKYSLRYIDFEDSQHMFMIHYQIRSIEEYLIKMEQAFSQWKRDLIFGHRKCNHLNRRSYYDLNKAKGRPQKIPYATNYLNLVISILDQWPLVEEDVMLNSMDAIGIRFNGTAHWELYMFFKWAVASKYSWDDERYMQRNNVDLGEKFDDGLHHFMNRGFYSGLPGCFKTKAEKSFCVEKTFL